MNTAHIIMIGSGYVGLVSGACFAELGFTVTCIDKDEEKIRSLCAGEIPIYEEGLQALVHKNLANQRLQFKTTLSDIVHLSSIIFIAVGTPTDPKTGQANLCYVEGVARELAPLLTANETKTIVVKSTVPVGTGQLIKNIILSINPTANFNMVSNPEFLREGSAVADFMQPDRVIVGSESASARQLMNFLYQPLIEREIPVIHSDIETAEMIKYSANCFLATKIAFVNEIANLCEKLDADVENVMLGLGLDKRIGSRYLKPGPGYGGSCFPKDTLALAHVARSLDIPFNIIEAVIRSNEQRKVSMVDKIMAALENNIRGKTLAVLGVAFKANTDDVRDSAALTIISGLQKKGALIRAYDPVAMEKAAEVLTHVFWAQDSYEALLGADALVIITEWEEFSRLDLDRVKSQLASPLIIDLRNLYEVELMQAKGFRYVSVGRPEVFSASTAIPDMTELSGVFSF